ncbi:glutaminyl-peptide cyclotransferase-like protein [Tanacetum coccineum]|uniref:Glutaminyl-peptide cyclotransferase-like protein n=1 Tax=Tanacetum coccineum TaxID=301880 RepID=A0ABQ4WDH5_9ASTR
MAGGTMRKNSSISNDQPKILKPQQSSHFRTINSTLVLVSVLLAVVVILTSSFRYEGGSIYSFEVVNEFPHDPDAYTQGLLYVENDTLFESTGRIGHSSVREVHLLTGKVKALQNMDYSYFGEGLTLLGDRNEMTIHTVDFLSSSPDTCFILLKCYFTSFTHDLKEGWGLATDGKVLIGTSNCIARISPVDGTVIGWIVLPELRYETMLTFQINALNGIAWDDKKKRLFVTGKLWPKLYEIKLQPLRKPLQAPIEQLCLNAPFPIVTVVDLQTGKSDCIARISPADGTVIGWILLPELRYLP